MTGENVDAVWGGEREEKMRGAAVRQESLQTGSGSQHLQRTRHDIGKSSVRSRGLLKSVV
jgi:hypothetical protein